MWFAGVDLGAVNSSATPESVDGCVAHLLSSGAEATGATLVSPESDDAVLRLLLAAAHAKLVPSEVEEQITPLIAREDVRKRLQAAYNAIWSRGGLLPADLMRPSLEPPSIRPPLGTPPVSWQLMHAMGDRREQQRSIPVIQFTLNTARGPVMFQCTPDEAAELSAELHAALRAPLRCQDDTTGASS